MNNAGMIGDISQTIANFLYAKLNPSAGDDAQEIKVEVSSPYAKPEPSAPALSVFLYRITENPFYKNSPPDRLYDAQGKLGGMLNPPLCLDLHYLLIPNTKLTKDAHTYLGQALLAIHEEGGVIPQQHWDVDPEKFLREPRMVFSNLSIDDLNKIWSSYPEGLRLCVGFEVDLAIIQSSKVSPATQVEDGGVKVGVIPDLDKAQWTAEDLEVKG